MHQLRSEVQPKAYAKRTHPKNKSQYRRNRSLTDAMLRRLSQRVMLVRKMHHDLRILGALERLKVGP